MVTTYTTLTLGLRRQGPTFWIELALQDPTNQASIASVDCELELDTRALLGLQLEPERYGEELSRQIFAQDAVLRHFLDVERAVQASEKFLRISLRVESSAQELHGLRWELLRHPERGDALATSERVLFSRFMVSTDWRPVRLRAQKTALRALVAVSAPPAEALARANLAPIDFAGEVARARSALVGLTVTVLGGPGAPCTLEALALGSRDVDVLYIVAHGAFNRGTNAPILYLQDLTGELVVTKGDALAGRLRELVQGPRVVVLASCQSAGDGELVDPAQRGSVSSTLAAQLANAGAPAVVAMQGQIRMDTVERMMPVFFTELLRDGQVDRALAVARGVVRDQPDHWMPVLFLRLVSGQIWYTPGFGGDTDDETWKKLVKPVQQGRLVPLLGPGLLEHICGTSFTVARHMAERFHFPLADYEWDDLPRVTQFLSVKESRQNAVDAYKAQLAEDMVAMHRDVLGEEAHKSESLGRLLERVAIHTRDTEPDEPYKLIAGLGARFFLTTNFDTLLISALKAKNRAPVQVLTSWRHPNKAVVRDTHLTEPTVEAPLVFHALGAFRDLHAQSGAGKSTDDSLVLTEDDYFNYLITVSSEQRMPDTVAGALTDNSLLFLGFRLTDWSFRVLFRLIMGLESSANVKKHCHVAVQVDPDLHSMADVEGAKDYLKDYFRTAANIDIFWGTPREFLSQLQAELARAAPLAQEPQEKCANPDFNY